MRKISVSQFQGYVYHLRKIRMDDLLEYYERLYGDGDVCRYLLFDPHQDISESMASIEKTLDRYEAENGGAFHSSHRR